MQYPISEKISLEFKDQTEAQMSKLGNFFEKYEYLIQLKLFDIQNELKGMDFIEFTQIQNSYRCQIAIKT
jgi:hypothetical protein